MLRHKKDGIEWLTFELLANCKFLNHGILMREGGFSSNPFFSLNLGAYCSDNPSLVARNLEKIQKTLDLPPLCLPQQVHGTTIWEAGRTQSTSPFPADALVINNHTETLLITHADCQAAIFYDPQEHVLANVHCGWRGNVQNIYQTVIHFLCHKHHSKPQNILVGISPSLGPQHAEFLHYQKELPQNFWDFQVKPFFFDLWAIAKMQLQSCGILPEHIEIAEMDTFSNSVDFFSYRRDRITGRNGTFANLLKKG